MEIFEFLKRLHDESVDLSKKIVFDKRHPRQLHLIGLYGTLIELAGCLIILIELQHKTGVPSIFRTFLEAYVEFSNLHSDAKYGYYMEASDSKQWLNVLQEAKKNTNPFLNAISKSNDLDTTIKNHQTSLLKLKKKGYEPLKVWERFKKAGMEHEYRSIYNFLSNDAHSNIRALVARHIEIHDNDFSVVYYKDEPLESFLHDIQATAELLTDALMKIHGIFKTDFLKEVKILNKELNEIRSRHETEAIA